MVRLLGNTSLPTSTLMQVAETSERWSCVNRSDLQAPACQSDVASPRSTMNAFRARRRHPLRTHPLPPAHTKVALEHGAPVLPAMLLEPLSNTSLFKWLAVVSSPVDEGASLTLQ